MSRTAPRRFAVFAAVTAAVAVPAVQAWLKLGLSQAEFASQGDSTLRAAGYAFSIWGLIYLGLIAYALFQARARDTALLRAFGWPSAVAIAACALWIVAAALNLRAASVAVILVGAAFAVAPLLGRPQAASATERLVVLWPNAALAGWLTIASALNILTVLTAEGRIPAAQAMTWALAGLAVVLAAGAAIALRSRSAVHLLPIAWGLGGVYVAEKLRQPTVSLVAATGAVVLLLLAGWIAARRR